jgi:hypothetical protein
MEIEMKRFVLTAVAALSLLLGGCATTVRSDVTTFHQWPAEVQDKTYVIEAPSPQEDTLELRSYQNLVRAELAKLGFQDVGAGGTPALKVSMRFTTADVPVKVIQAIDPFFVPTARIVYHGPYQRRHWTRGWYSPFYDPYWYGMPMLHETIQHHYQRELQVAIKSARDDKRLFDVTVHNTSREMSTPALMPALVQSAFEGFPGPNGGARRIELKQNG